MEELDPRDPPSRMQKSSNNVEEIRQAAAIAAKHYTQVIAIERSTRGQLLKNAAKIANPHREHLRDSGTWSGRRSSAPIPLDSKSLHTMREPQVPCLVIVGGHAKSLLYGGIELVKQMCIHPDADSNDEIAGDRCTAKTADPHLSYGDTARFGGKRDADRFCWIFRKS